jgi:mannitol/fructose-specific phosphotransferase system IIA component (Ntr-type)
MFSKLIESATIIESLVASAKADVLKEMLKAGVDSGGLAVKNTATLRKKLAEREKLGSTGIGNGVAVPHVKSGAISEVCMILGRSVQGIDYQAIDGRPVHTVFLLVVPTDQAEVHLQSLRWIASLARNPDFRRFVLSASGEAGIRELLHEMNTSE